MMSSSDKNPFDQYDLEDYVTSQDEADQASPTQPKPVLPEIASDPSQGNPFDAYDETPAVEHGDLARELEDEGVFDIYDRFVEKPQAASKGLPVSLDQRDAPRKKAKVGLDLWEKETSYLQDRIDNPVAGDKSRAELEADLAYARKRLSESQDEYTRADETRSKQGGDFLTSMSRGFTGALEAGAAGVRQYGESIGSKNLTQAGLAAEGVLRAEREDIPRPRVESFTQIGEDGNFWRDVREYAVSKAGEGIGSTIPFLSGGVVAGTPGLVAAGSAMGHGAMVQALDEAGVTDPQVRERAVYTYGSAIAALDVAVPTHVMLQMSGAAKELAKENLTQAIVGSIKTAGVTAFAEGATEMGQEFTEMYGASGQPLPNGQTSPPIDWEQARVRGIDSFLSGLVPGATFTAPEAGTRIASARVGKKTKTDATEAPAPAEEQAAPEAAPTTPPPTEPNAATITPIRPGVSSAEPTPEAKRAMDAAFDALDGMEAYDEGDGIAESVAAAQPNRVAKDPAAAEKSAKAKADRAVKAAKGETPTVAGAPNLDQIGADILAATPQKPAPKAKAAPAAQQAPVATEAAQEAVPAQAAPKTRVEAERLLQGFEIEREADMQTIQSLREEMKGLKRGTAVYKAANDQIQTLSERIRQRTADIKQAETEVDQFDAGTGTGQETGQTAAPAVEQTPATVAETANVQPGNQAAPVAGAKPGLFVESSGQLSLVPEVTTKQKLESQSAKPMAGGSAPMDIGLFGSGAAQTDLLDKLKTPAVKLTPPAPAPAEPSPKYKAKREADIRGSVRKTADAVAGTYRRHYNKLKRARKPVSLISFLTAQGGINDVGGDLRAMDANKRIGLIRAQGKGLDPDKAREAAVEAGYPADAQYQNETTSTVSDLFEAIREELSGKPAYAVADRAYTRDLDSAKSAADSADRLLNDWEDEIGNWFVENDYEPNLTPEEFLTVAQALDQAGPDMSVDDRANIIDETVERLYTRDYGDDVETDAGTVADASSPSDSQGRDGERAADEGVPFFEGTEPAEDGAQGGSQIEPDLRSRFYDLLAGKARRPDWARTLGVDEAGLAPLIQDGLENGWLRVDSNGEVRRVDARKRPARPDRAAPEQQVLSALDAPMPRPKLSIAPTVRAAIEAKRAEETPAERSKRLNKPFAAQPQTTQWLGFPPSTEFTANVEHIATKRATKDGANHPLANPENVRTHIETVLSNAKFAFHYKMENGWTLVVPQSNGEDLYVGIDERLDRGRVFIRTAFIANKGKTQRAITQAVLDYGPAEALKWKKDLSALREIQTLVRPAPGEGLDPSVAQLKASLKKSQDELASVQAAIEAAGAYTKADAVQHPETKAREEAYALVQTGKVVNIPASTVKRVQQVLKRHVGMVPPDADVLVLERIAPIAGDTENVLVSFRSMRGKLRSVRLKKAGVVGDRAVFIPTLNAIAFYRFGERVGAAEQETLAGEIWHELIHLLRRRGSLNGVLWDRLVRFARHERNILNLSAQEFMRAIGNPSWPLFKNPNVTLEQIYRDRARQAKWTPEFTEEALDQEAATHLAELVYHNVLSPAQISEVQDIFDLIGSQTFGRGAATLEPGDPLYDVALRANPQFLAAVQASRPPLDMSPEARKARAEAQGFDTSVVFYRGDGQLRDGTRVSPHYGAVYTSMDPEVANGAVLATKQLLDEKTPVPEGSVVIPMWGKTAGLFDYRNAEHRARLEKALTPLIDPRAPRAVALTAADLKSKIEGGFWGFFEKPAVHEALKDLGFTGYHAQEDLGKPASSTAFFNPADLRSPSASFDPSLDGENNLLYAMAPSRPALDMSPEARKARAEEMGFDTSRVLYHGTGATFDAFDPREAVENAIFLTNDRKAAQAYDYRGGKSPKVLDVYARLSNPLVLEGNDQQAIDLVAGAPFNVDGDRVRAVKAVKSGNGFEVTIEAGNGRTRELIASESAKGRMTVVDQDGAVVVKDTRISNPLSELTAGRAVEVAFLTDRTALSPARLFLKDMVAEAKSAGHDGIILRQVRDHGSPAHDQIIVFDPSNIRSVNANFDPALDGENNLLYAMGGDPNGNRTVIEPEQPRVNEEGATLILPFKERWGDPRFNPADRERAIARAKEIFELDFKAAPWADIVQAKADINQILANLYYYKSDTTAEEMSRFDEIGYAIRTSDKRSLLVEADEDLIDLVRPLRRAVDRMLLLSTRKGMKALMYDNVTDDPNQPKEKKKKPAPGVNETMPSGFYFLSGRKLGEVPADLFQQGGRAVINWLSQAGVKKAEIEHFQLEELADQKPVTREAFEKAINDRVFDFRRKVSWLNPERSKKDYELGGTRAFRGPRLPGRGLYFERLMRFPKRLRGGETMAAGFFKSPHWEDVFPGTWASWRGSLRDIEGWGKTLVGEEGQTDMMQGALGRGDDWTGRRPRITNAEYLRRKKLAPKYMKVMFDARGTLDDIQRVWRNSHAVRTKREGSLGSDTIDYLLPSLQSVLLTEGRDRETWDMSIQELYDATRLPPSVAQGTNWDDLDSRERNLVLDDIEDQRKIDKAIDTLVQLRTQNEEFFAKDAKDKFGRLESQFTPATPIDDTYVRDMARDLILAATEQNADSLAISTSETTNRIQINTEASAAHFYDTQLRRAIEKELRRITPGQIVTMEKVKLPKAMGAPKREKAYTVWAVRLTPAMKGVVQSEGMPLFALGAPVEPARPKPLLEIMSGLRESVGLTTVQQLRGLTVGVRDARNRFRQLVRLIPNSRGMAAEVTGQYDRKGGVAYIRSPSDMVTVSHEAAHKMEDTFGDGLETVKQAHAAELVPLSKGGGPSLSEGFGDWFSSYVMNPAAAKTQAPGFYAAFEEFLDAENPGMLEGLQAAQAEFRAYDMAAPEGRAVADVATGAPISKANVAVRMVTQQFTKSARATSAMLRGEWNRAYQEMGEPPQIMDFIGRMMIGSFTDRAHPIRAMVKKMLKLADANGVRDANGKKITLKVWENAYKIARMIPGAYKSGHMFLVNGVPTYGGFEAEGPSLQQAIDLAMSAQAKGLQTKSRRWRWNKEALDTFGAYLISHRAIAEYERWEAAIEKRRQLTETIDQATAMRGSATETLRKVQAQIATRQRRLSQAQGRLAQIDKEITWERGRVETWAKSRSPQAKARLTEAMAGIRRFDNERADIIGKIPTLESEIADRQDKADRLQAAIDGLAQVIESSKKELDLVNKYEPNRRPTDKSKEAHIATKAAMEQQFPDFIKAQKMVAEWQRRLLTYEFDAGRWTPEVYEKLLERADWYVPFMRRMDEPDTGPSEAARAWGDKVFSTKTGGIKKFRQAPRFRGSDRQIINPLESLTERAYHTGIATMFNDMTRSLADLAEKVGKGGEQIAARVRRTDVLEAVDGSFKELEEIAIAQGMDVYEAHMMVQRFEQDFSDSELELLWSPKRLGPGKVLTVPLWEGGKRNMVRLNDPELMESVFTSMQGLSSSQLNLVTRLLGLPSRALSRGTVTHIAYVIPNLARDAVLASIYTGSLPGWTQVKGIYYELGESRGGAALLKKLGIEPPKIASTYAAASGIMGGQMTASSNQIMDKADLKELRYHGFHFGNWRQGLNPFSDKNWAATFAEGSETATRLGVFAHALKRAKAAGMSDTEAIQEAAFTARDMIDFDRRGSKMHAVAHVVSFLNSAVQGLSVANRKLFTAESDRGSAYVEALKILVKGERGQLSVNDQKALAVAARVVVLGSIVSVYFLLMHMMYADDDEYKEIMEESKWRDMPVRYVSPWTGKTEWGRIPRPFEAAFPGNVLIAAYDYQSGRDPRFGARVADAALQNIVPPYTPQFVTTIGGMAYNTDGFGNPIVNMGLAGVEPYLQFDQYSSEFAKWLAFQSSKVGIKMSAKKIDYALRMGGYWGQDLQLVSNQLFSDDEKPGIEDQFLLGPLAKRLSTDLSRASAGKAEFWNQMQEGSGEYSRAADSYGKFLESEASMPLTAKEYLATLDEERRAYALLKNHFKGKTSIIRLHPLQRAQSIMEIEREMANEVRALKGFKVGEGDEATTVPVSTLHSTELRQMLGMLQTWEAANALIAVGHEQWSMRQPFDTDQIWTELEASSPELVEELKRRIEKKKVESFEVVRQAWPKIRDELNNNMETLVLNTEDATDDLDLELAD